MPRESLKIGDWLLEPRLNRLSRDGRIETLEPLAAEVLAYLAEHAGEVVSADRLTETLWPRRFVGDSPVYRIMADLRRTLGDDARAPTYIETIRKRGYRLIAAVERHPGNTESAARVGEATSEIRASSVAPGDAPVINGASIRRYALPAALAAGFTIFAIIGWIATRIHGEMPSAGDAPATLSVAVLPFLDMSAAKDSEHIGDGIAEALIHQLAQVPDMRVIARNSSFTFKGTSTDVREIGRALNVQAVLEGSVQRARDELRITAQLVDTQTGMHIWSRQFDRNAGEIFAVQDEIALAVFEEVSGASPESADPPRSAEVTDDLDAYDFYLLGRARLRSRATDEARRLFTRALALDPTFALAHTGLAEALLYDAGQNYLGLSPDVEALERARAALDRALELEPDQIEARASRILLAKLDRDWAAVDAAFAAAREPGPGYALTYYYYADALSAWGRETLDRPHFDRALPNFLRAQSLDPLNPLVARSLALYYRMDGRRRDAMAEAYKVYDLAANEDDMLLALDLLSFMTYEFGELDRTIAFAHLERSVRGAPTPAAVHRIALSYYQLGDRDKSAEWFGTATDDREEERLFFQAHLAHTAGDTARFEAIIDRLLNYPSQGVDAEFSYSDAIMVLASVGLCDRALAAGETLGESYFREQQPAADIYLAACHAQLATGAGGPHEERLKDHLANYEAFGLNTRIGLLQQASIASVFRDRDKTLTRLEETLTSIRGVWWLSTTLLFEWLDDDERYKRLMQETAQENAGMLARIYAAETNGDWCGLAELEPRGALISAGACVAE